MKKTADNIRIIGKSDVLFVLVLIVTIIQFRGSKGEN